MPRGRRLELRVLLRGGLALAGCALQVRALGLGVAFSFGVTMLVDAALPSALRILRLPGQILTKF